MIDIQVAIDYITQYLKDKFGPETLYVESLTNVDPYGQTQRYITFTDPKWSKQIGVLWFHIKANPRIWFQLNGNAISGTTINEPTQVLTFTTTNFESVKASTVSAQDIRQHRDFIVEQCVDGKCVTGLVKYAVRALRKNNIDYYPELKGALQQCILRKLDGEMGGAPFNEASSGDAINALGRLVDIAELLADRQNGYSQ